MKNIVKKIVVVSLICMLGFSSAVCAQERPTREETLAEIKKDFGFVPNLLNEMSRIPAAPLV